MLRRLRIEGMLRGLFLLLAAVVVIASAPQLALAQKSAGWPQHLGPARNGISPETGLLNSWPEGGPKEVWRVEGGTGMSGVAVAGGLLTTMLELENKQLVVGLDPKSGKTLWQTEVSPAYRNSMGNGPRALPCIAGGSVYAYSGEGILVALSAKDGKELWRHDTVKELGGRVASYGMACSPLIVGKNVVVTVGAPEATVVAYDAKSGKQAWTAGKEDTCGYSSPAVLKVGGREQLVVFTGKAVIGLVPESGKQLWRFEFETDYDTNIITPVAVGDDVFISAGENHGSALLKLTASGEGFEAKEVWSSLDSKSVLRAEWQTPILVDGYFYAMDNVGAAGPITHLTCVEAATGKPVWQEVRFGKGNLIAADGKLWMTTMKGEVVVAKINPKAYEEIGRAKVFGRSRQAPSIADGLLYVRDDKEIVCLDVRAK